jgi:hypothetical protein
MANLTKLKRRSTLGAPPTLDEASQNLKAPEIAPGNTQPAQADGARAASDKKRLDGRTLRKTGRTLQLATRVSPEFDERLRCIAQRDGLKLVEVLERGLDAYEDSRR